MERTMSYREFVPFLAMMIPSVILVVAVAATLLAL
jgi:hypothetical protein